MSAAQRYPAELGRLGVRSLFVNAGTDFAPLIEAYAGGGPEALPREPEQRPGVALHDLL
jgi:acetolactate synthase-1/2/3 large subunit